MHASLDVKERFPESLEMRVPVGAEPGKNGGVRFRVWAPHTRKAAVVLSKPFSTDVEVTHVLSPEENGYWYADVAEAETGMFYQFRIDEGIFPDPASRFQPEGPHGPSQIIDANDYHWNDTEWRGVTRRGQVIYEMHIGTFTPEGTWSAAIKKFDHLEQLGVTLLEIMPLNDFSGRYGWGYDGVNLFAPSRLYGTPSDLRAFVDEAHRRKIGVILDVVYNHFGPDGNFLPKFAPEYISTRHKNDWGDPVNFDGELSEPVREFFIANAGYWIEEFHLDGLRLDATPEIHDDSSPHILRCISEKVRAAAGERSVLLLAENERQDVRLIRPIDKDGFGADAIWNDDFHHSAIVAMTGRTEAYYTDYRGTPQEFVSAAKWGFLYQGQFYKWQKNRRGTPSLDFEPDNFVNFLQNHDQIANSLWGRRIHTLTSAGRLRALTALLLLGPNTPMLFQGQEFAASAPFLYFADHEPALAKSVAKGRAEFLKQFPSIAAEDTTTLVARPEEEETFLKCKLDFDECERHGEILRLHKDLIHLRQNDPLLKNAVRGTFDGAVLGQASFVLRYFGKSQNDRLLLINLGPGFDLDPAPEPLLAPVLGCEWETAWSSEDPAYGGNGTPSIETAEGWRIPAESALLLVPKTAKN